MRQSLYEGHVTFETRGISEKDVKRKKAIIGIVLAVVLTFTSTEAAMVADTHDFMEYAHKVFNGEVSSEELDADNKLWAIYLPDDNDGQYECSYRLVRLFTWHDFRKGFILVSYTTYRRDLHTGKVWSEGEQRYWYIEKVVGEWKLVGLNPVKA